MAGLLVDFYLKDVIITEDLRREVMSGSLPKVLIVEDENKRQDFYALALMGRVEILRAQDLRTAEELFQGHPDVSLIVMDACVPGDNPTTPPLVEKIRKTFQGPMIAASSDEYYREILMNYGCDHEASKDQVPVKVRELLSLQ